jgi:hypothetical protein
MQDNIVWLMIVVEVLRFLVCQCVVSFHSPFQYGLLSLLTPHFLDPSINAILFAFNNIAINVDPPLSLLGAVTIMVKKSLVNSITDFSFIL